MLNKFVGRMKALAVGMELEVAVAVASAEACFFQLRKEYL